MIEEIENIIKKHMDGQPYEIKCCCGNELNCDVRLDSYLDIYLEVGPCQECIREKKINENRRIK
jgi:hypothetical protein